MIDLTGRHPATVSIAAYFAYQHLREDLQPVSRIFHDAVVTLLQLVDDGPELTVALRKLLEAKDAAVRAAL